MGSKHYRKLIIVTTNCEKSAEVIVLEEKNLFQEGPNNSKI